MRLPDSFIDRIEEIKELTDVRSRSDVLRDSFCAYQWILDQIKQGNKIIAVNSKNGSEKEITISTPGTEVVKAKREK